MIQDRRGKLIILIFAMLQLHRAGTINLRPVSGSGISPKRVASPKLPLVWLIAEGTGDAFSVTAEYPFQTAARNIWFRIWTLPQREDWGHVRTFKTRQA
jgi:hypothetical protein